MKQAVWLNSDNLIFPPVEQALDDPPGLLAAGGDLRPERLLAAYRQGIFPWYDSDETPILWWSPDPRMVMPPSNVHISRSTARLIRRQQYQLSMDEQFDSVIEHCAQLRQQREGTWITADMIEAYTNLHRLGYAHSVEVCEDGRLVGGLYGVSLGGLFFGESMFSLQPSTSKLAFIALARQLQAWQFSLIDCQMPTGHLYSLGAEAVARRTFINLLDAGLQAETRVGPWCFDAERLDLR